MDDGGAVVSAISAGGDPEIAAREDAIVGYSKRIRIMLKSFVEKGGFGGLLPLKGSCSVVDGLPSSLCKTDNQ